MIVEDKYYGSFTVTGDKLRVSDPCYEIDSTGGITLDNVKPGEWYTHAVLIDKHDGWDTRVAEITATHETYPDHYEPGVPYSSKPVIAVDSGQAGIFDQAKYPAESEGEERDEFYGDNCNLTLSDEFGGIVSNMGVVTCSGYGDGCYRLFYDYDKDKKIVSVAIVFIDTEEDEEDY